MEGEGIERMTVMKEGSLAITVSRGFTNEEFN